MVYAYLRVSTDKQQLENQRHEISLFARNLNMEIDVWVQESISGGIEKEVRSLGGMMDDLKSGDILIVSELSRLSRKMLDIMDIMNTCLKREVVVFCIKEGFELKGDIASKILLFAFGLTAEVEKDLISQRTKEALAMRKAKGIVLGRPKGSATKYNKLMKHEREIREMLERNLSKKEIDKRLKVSRPTLYKFLNSISLIPV